MLQQIEDRVLAQRSTGTRNAPQLLSAAPAKKKTAAKKSAAKDAPAKKKTANEAPAKEAAKKAPTKKSVKAKKAPAKKSAAPEALNSETVTVTGDAQQQLQQPIAENQVSEPSANLAADPAGLAISLLDSTDGTSTDNRIFERITVTTEKQVTLPTLPS